MADVADAAEGTIEDEVINPRTPSCVSTRRTHNREFPISAYRALTKTNLRQGRGFNFFVSH